MTNKVVYKLISNDLKINRTPILLWALTAVTGIVVAYFIPGLVAANIGFSLLASAIIGVGIHMLAHTVLYDNLKGTHIFVMSLPINFKQYTLAKLSVNLLVFYFMWALLSAACIYVTLSRGIFPAGSLPMVLMVLFSILPVYSLMLSISILTQSIGYTIVTVVTLNFATVAYLWKIVYLDSIGSYVWGDHAVWNSTVLGIILIQLLVTIIIPVSTIIIQFKKKDVI
ncbi:MAG: ABC-2 transporter permease [Melioribacteraceae bacterium]|nr:ABC-2 transporter permease [Melioribacteraceae bacterium]MCF8263384.1 ABC-2 transporter permease [Melioribacteraceae bacterium]MCF8430870.1 ABC-2 transporter permease [Melioribacteraceae bacterium]